ncbi:anti-sigma factor domain-containing protein [Bacillus songklensis]|uniref:Anti-sigma factor domain-containing protein n=1 Tax=Bacillus songklensis TaxID=1069116 RepID=A0ABV8AZE4_9BACI
MKKGIVMEITEDYVTMLTPEGEFLRARHEQRPYELGEETLFFPLMHEQTLTSPAKIKRRSWRLPMVSFVAAAALLLSFIPYYMQQQVYAYMSIDINPSLELGVNRQLEVVEVQTFNEEAKALIKSIKDWDHKPVQEVTSQILKASEQQGYLKREKEVFVATVFKREKREYKEQLLADIQTVTKEWGQKDYKIEIVKSSLDVRGKAEKMGVSTGTWLKREESKRHPHVKPAETSQPIKPKVSQQVKSKEYVSSFPPKKEEQHKTVVRVLASKQAEEQKKNNVPPAKQQVKSKPAPKPDHSKKIGPKGEQKEKRPKPPHPVPPSQSKEKPNGGQKEKVSTAPKPVPPGQNKEKPNGGQKAKDPNPPKPVPPGQNKEKPNGGQKAKDPDPPKPVPPGQNKEKPNGAQKAKDPDPSKPVPWGQDKEKPKVGPKKKEDERYYPDPSCNIGEEKQDSTEALPTKSEEVPSASPGSVNENRQPVEIQIWINVSLHTSS